MKVKSSKLNSELQTPNSKPKKGIAFLWDESFLWGLMAYKALMSNGLPFEPICSDDIKRGLLKNYTMLFVPGGWASNKLKTLGGDGISEIKRFVNNGGNYLGFCGGAGLATLDGIGLLSVKRRPTKERVPSFSGRIYLNINEHPIWNSKELRVKSLELKKENQNNPSLVTCHSSLVFHAWWPSQFLIDDRNIKILATYGDALPDSFSSDLNVGDVEANGCWSELEEIYKINLNPKRLIDEPAIIEGYSGKGKVILSLVHFDTPDDTNGARVLKNLWEYLNGSNKLQVTSNIKDSNEFLVKSDKLKNDSSFSNSSLVTCYSSLIEKLESAVSELISLGQRNFLWFWRNSILLQWRRGVRGLEYCTLYVMIKEIAEILKNQNTENRIQKTDINKIKELLVPFVEKAKRLLILERHAMQNGHITPLSPPLLRGGWGGENAPEIQRIRAELFGNSKSHGGMFKKLIDEVDGLLYALIDDKQN